MFRKGKAVNRSHPDLHKTPLFMVISYFVHLLTGPALLLLTQAPTKCLSLSFPRRRPWTRILTKIVCLGGDLRKPVEMMLSNFRRLELSVVMGKVREQVFTVGWLHVPHGARSLFPCLEAE